MTSCQPGRHRATLPEPTLTRKCRVAFVTMPRVYARRCRRAGIVRRSTQPSSARLGPRNKARHAGPHHSVEAHVRRDAVPDLLHGVFRQGRNVEVLLDAAEAWSRWSGKRCRAGRPRPARLERASCATRCAMAAITGSSSRFGLHAMAERGKGQQDDSLLATEVEQFPFGQIRMRFDLHHGGLDPRSGDDLPQLFQSDVR